MTAPVPWRSTHLDRRPATLDQVVHESIGLYSTPPVSHLELCARLPGHRPADLDAAFARREMVGLRCLRGSGFLMPVDLLPVVLAATRERNERAFRNHVRKILVTASYETWAERIEDLLSDVHPRTVAEIKDALDVPEEDREGLGFAIRQMAAEGRLITTRVAVSWRSSRNAYLRWQDWIPEVDTHSIDAQEARADLARLYLGAWGPATVDDFAWWSGLTKTQARTAIRAGDAEAVEYDGTELFQVGEVDDAPPKGVRLLPIWDTLFVTWKDRSRFVPDHLLPFIYDASGNATSVVLVDGAVAGVWSLGSDDADLEIKVAPFDRFTSAQLRGIETEANLIGTMAGSEQVRVVECSTMPSLVDGPWNLFMRPLREC